MSDTFDLQSAYRWIEGFAEAVGAHKEELTDLDAAIGDGDHGTNMDRGMRAVMAKLGANSSADLGDLFKTVGMTLVSTVGGASGPLFGTFFLALGKAWPNKETLSADELLSGYSQAVAAVIARGRAERGDKTMVDALLAAQDAWEMALGGTSGDSETLSVVAAAAAEGAEQTVPLVARKGRASYLGKRSAGHKDPGAATVALMMAAAADARTGE